MRLLALIGKELRTFLRDPALVFVVVFLFVVHPYQSGAQSSQSGFALSNYPVAAYDLDRTPQSTAFIEKLRPPYFTLRRMVRTDGEISGLLDRGEVSMVVVVPEGFARRIHRGEAASVQVLGDGTYSPTSQLAGASVRIIAQQFAAAQGHASPYQAKLPIVDARLEITASKIIPMILLGTAATLVSLGVLVWAFALPIRGSPVLFLVATALTVFSMSGISLVIATFTRTLPSTMILAFMLIIPIQFLSGSVTPVEAMPPLQYYLTLLSPQRYYLNIGYSILLKGASLATLWRDFAGLTLVGGGLFILGARRFQRQFG